jgi:LysM repeat protein
MMKKRKLLFLLLLSSFGMGGCYESSVSREENAAVDVTLQQVETRLDDSKHEVHCLQTDLQILDSRIKQLETSVASLKNVSRDLLALEQKQQEILGDVKQLSLHANETSTSFSQYKNRMKEFEKELSTHHQKLNEVHQLKGSLESVAETIKQISSSEATYRVRQGDSLEKIAKKYKVSVDSLKRANGFEQDRIQVGQELKIPAHP